MSIIQKSDKYTEALSKTIETGFTSKNIIDTMRFSDLDGMEEFSNTMAYANARSWLYTGISQIQREAEALKKYKAGDKSEVPAGAEYDPKVVDDLLDKWSQYDTTKPPEEEKNFNTIINHLWRYNRNLMWAVHVFLPSHLAVLNGKYATKGGRTFNALVSLGKNMWQRELETNIERGNGGGRSLRHPFRSGNKDEQ